MFFPFRCNVTIATNDFAQNLNHLVKSSVKLLKLVAGGPCQMETSLFVAVGILN